MVGTLLAVTDFELHPEVWLLVGAVIALGVYSVRAIGPLVVPAGEPVVTIAQKRFFIAGVALLWFAADWPMHDIAEEHLYFMHMVQLLLITFVVPPLLLLAMPAWLARLIILEDGVMQRVLRFWAKPIVAGVVFNGLQILTHWGEVVNLSVENGAFHYGLHPAAVALSALVVFPIAPYAAAVMITAAALPVAGNVYILAQHYRVAPQRVSASILISTVAAVVSVSLVIGWVSSLY